MFEVNRTGNAIVYQTAVNRLITYCGRDVYFTEINYQLLDEFKHYLMTSGLKQNSISMCKNCYSSLMELMLDSLM